MALRDWFWILLLGGIWGFSFIFNAILIEEVGPLWVSGLRVSIGALGCWVVLIALRKPLPRNAMLWLQLGGIGLLNFSIPFALYPLAQGSLASGVAAIINALTPITTVIISLMFKDGERATPFKIVGVIFGFAGVAILASPALADGGNTRLWAIGACILATICYAFALNFVRNFKSVEPTALAVVAMTGAGLASLITAFVGEGIPTITLPQTWAAALGIGLIATTFTFVVMYRILPRVGATNFSTVTFIAPISAIIFGFILLGETIELTHILGMLAIFAGLLMIDGRLPLWLGIRRARRTH